MPVWPPVDEHHVGELLDTSLIRDSKLRVAGGASGHEPSRGDWTLLSAGAALYFVAVDAGGDAMDDGTWNEAADGAGAFFMNFFSGI